MAVIQHSISLKHLANIPNYSRLKVLKSRYSYICLKLRQSTALQIWFKYNGKYLNLDNCEYLLLYFDDEWSKTESKIPTTVRVILYMSKVASSTLENIRYTHMALFRQTSYFWNWKWKDWWEWKILKVADVCRRYDIKVTDIKQLR